MKSNDDGSTEVIKESRHDFSPIKIRTHIVKRSQAQDMKLTLLVSKHLTTKQFQSYLTLVKQDVGSRVEMFVVRPEGQAIIYDVPQERRTLEELGIRNLTDVVIFDSELQPENCPNKSEFYHTIGKMFNIAKEEYASLLPKVTPGTGGDQGGSFFDKSSGLPPSTGNYYPSSPQKPARNAIPPEY